MASDGLGPDGIEVDGDMSRPSDPMLRKQKNADVLAPIAFSVGKTFWKKFLRNGVTSVTSVTSIDFIDVFSKHFQALQAEQIRSRDFYLSESKNPQKNL